MASMIQIAGTNNKAEERHTQVLLVNVIAKTGVIVNIARMVERILKSVLADVSKWCPTFLLMLGEEYKQERKMATGEDTSATAFLQNLIMNISDLKSIVGECHKDLSKCPIQEEQLECEDADDIVFESSDSAQEIYVINQKIADKDLARNWFDIVNKAMTLSHCTKSEVKEYQSLFNLIDQIFKLRNNECHYTSKNIEASNNDELKHAVRLYKVICDSGLLKFDNMENVDTRLDGDDKVSLSPKSVLQAAEAYINISLEAHNSITSKAGCPVAENQQLVEKLKFRHQQTLVYIACETGNTENLKLTMGSASHTQWYQILQMKDIAEVLSVHDAAELGYSVEELMKSKRTPLHNAVLKGHGEVVKLLQQMLTMEQWCQLFKIEDESGCTPLLAVLYEGDNMLTVIRDAITKMHRMKNLTIMVVDTKRPVTSCQDSMTDWYNNPLLMLRQL